MRLTGNGLFFLGRFLNSKLISYFRSVDIFYFFLNSTAGGAHVLGRHPGKSSPSRLPRRKLPGGDCGLMDDA